MKRYLDEWIHGVSGRTEYMEKLGGKHKARLRPKQHLSPSVDFGLY